jgi:tetratricopeptide (TPR) repeat protein
VQRLLSPDPRDRPHDASDVAEILEGHGARSPPWPAPRPTLHRPPLCGREGALRQLRSALGDGTAGRVVILAGPPGSGKTRLCSEVTELLSEHRCVVQPRHAPFVPQGALEQLRRVVSLREGELVEASFDERLERWDRAVREHLLREPVLWVVEDADTLDEFTRTWVERLPWTLSVRPAPLVVLLLCRGESPVPAHARVELPPLLPAQSLAVIQGALGDDTFTGGPPFETPGEALRWVRSAIEARALVRREGRWQLLAPHEDEPVLRLQALSEPVRQALAAAAVLGPGATLGRAVRLTSAHAVREALVQGVLLREASRLVPDDDRLARAVLDQPQPWHARVVQVLEEEGLLEQAPGALAPHLEAAGDPRAGRVWARAGQAADLWGSVQQARHAHERAVALLPAGPERGRAAIALGVAALEVQQSATAELALRLGMAEAPEGDYRAHLMYARERAIAGDMDGARQILAPLVERDVPYAAITAARLEREAGDLARAAQLFVQAGPGDPTALGGLAMMARQRGDLAEALRLLDQAVACCDPSTPARVAHDLKLKRAVTRSMVDPGRGVLEFSELFVATERRGHSAISWPCAVNLGIALADSGWCEQARGTLCWVALRLVQRRHVGHLSLVCLALAQLELMEREPSRVAPLCELADTLRGQGSVRSALLRVLAAAGQQDLEAVRAVPLREEPRSEEDQWLLQAGLALQQGPEPLRVALQGGQAHPMAGHVVSSAAVLYPELLPDALAWWRARSPGRAAARELAWLGEPVEQGEAPPVLPPELCAPPALEEVLSLLQRLSRPGGAAPR